VPVLISHIVIVCILVVCVVGVASIVGLALICGVSGFGACIGPSDRSCLRCF